MPYASNAGIRIHYEADGTGPPLPKAEVGKLPLTERGFMTYEFIPVGPLAPLGRLIQSK